MRRFVCGLAVLSVLAAACSEKSTEPEVIPDPVLTAVSPSEIQIGSPDVTITFTGTGFQRESVTRFDSTGLATTYVSETELRAVVPARLLDRPGPWPVSVFTLAVGKSSQVQNVTVFFAMPALDSISHDTATAGQTHPAPVRMRGSGFFFGTQVLWNGQPITTLYQNPTTVVFNPVVTTPGTYQVSVRNPTPGGGTSTATRTFTVRPQS